MRIQEVHMRNKIKKIYYIFDFWERFKDSEKVTIVHSVNITQLIFFVNFELIFIFLIKL